MHVAACCLLPQPTRWRRFPPTMVERGLILAGGAAGIAAAFNAPIAGIVFAIEEIGRSFEKRNAGRHRAHASPSPACVCIAVLSNYLFYGAVDAQLRDVREWLMVPVIGIAGGCLGGCFAHAVADDRRRAWRAWRGGGRTWWPARSASRWRCSACSPAASPTAAATRRRAPSCCAAQPLPAHYPLAKAPASFVTLISAIPGGLFTPSLSVGAGLGQLAGAWLPEMNRQAVVLLAMGAYFSRRRAEPDHRRGDRHRDDRARACMTLPLLVTTVLAYHASRLVCPVSLYESLAQRFLRRLEDRRRDG